MNAADRRRLMEMSHYTECPVFSLHGIGETLKIFFGEMFFMFHIFVFESQQDSA